MERFWMVYAEGSSNAPAKKHNDEAEAKSEAERLARTLHTKVYVLEATKVVVESSVKWENLSDPIPF